MHLRFLGDTYDLAKGRLLSILVPDGPWGIIPMFTDIWNQEQITLYEQLVGGTVLNPAQFLLGRGRQAYFDNVTNVGNVFVDPDTGARLEVGGSNRVRYIFGHELIALMVPNSNSLVVSYDQSYANSTDQQRVTVMRAKIDWLVGQGAQGFGYLGQASFLILSCDPEAIVQARQNLLNVGVPDSRLVA